MNPTQTAIVTKVDVDEKTVTMQMETTQEPTATDMGVETKPPMSAVEEASMKFTQLLPYITKIATASPSKGGLVRVLKAHAEFPLGAGKPKLLNDNEKLLFNILQEINGYKSTILTEFMKASLQKEQNLKPKTEKEVENGN